MRRMFLLFSHQLTEIQKQNAIELFGIEEFVSLPKELQEVWSNVPPEKENVVDYIYPVLNWLQAQAIQGDIVLIQGDFGATHLAIKFSQVIDCIPVYATTRREMVETMLPDGSVKKESRFNHVLFRKYE